MEQQLSIGTLLSAARLLDLGRLNPSDPAAQNLFDITNETELRALFCGKLKLDKKNNCGSSASTSSHPYCNSPPSRKSSKHSRAAHNELEKNRRANLRGCLEQLKNLVPSLSDAARNTTLALLTRARDHILELEDANKVLRVERQRKEDERAALLAELEQLQHEEEEQEKEVVNVKKEEEEEEVAAENENAEIDVVNVNESSSRPESRASSTCTSSSRDSPYLLEYSPSSKPSMSPSESPKLILIDPFAEGLLPALPLTYPRPHVYPQTVIDLFQLQSTKFETSSFLPIHHLRV